LKENGSRRRGELRYQWQRRGLAPWKLNEEGQAMPQDGTTSTARRQFKIVGTRPLRPDGIDKVTGKARFGADMYAPGMLWGLVLRSPHAHARIKGIDAAKALALHGVKAVLTSADLPDHSNGDGNLRDALENVMARRKALYDGHPVAAVAALTP